MPVARPGFVVSGSEDLQALVSSPLLHLAKGIHKDDWQIFFGGTGCQPAAARSDQKFTSFMVCLQAALNGDGIMLGWEHLMQSYFELGLLARVGQRRVHTDRGYFACLNKRAAGTKIHIGSGLGCPDSSPTTEGGLL